MRMEKKLNAVIGIAFAILVLVLADKILHGMSLLQPRPVNAFGQFDTAKGWFLLTEAGRDLFSASASVGAIVMFVLRAVIKRWFVAMLAKIIPSLREPEAQEEDDSEDEDPEPSKPLPRVRKVVRKIRKEIEGGK